MTVWERLVGQSAAVEQLQSAAWAGRKILSGESATLAHSWLFTGPPGSGRSVAARCLAAALQCTGAEPGCGHCEGCRTVMAGSNPDVVQFSTDARIFPIREVREEWRKVAYSEPVFGRWRILIVEDADRLQEDSQNTLLKSLEEPPPRTLWLLSVPRADDMLVTVRSRCRHLALVTPPVEDVADLLRQEMGADQDAALRAAQISQSHVGYARALVRDPELRSSQVDLFMTALRVNSVGEAVLAADALVKKAKAAGEARFTRRHQDEEAALLAGFGVEKGKRLPRGLQSQMKQLTDRHKRELRRSQVDELDRIFVDLLGFFRDVQVTQLGNPVPLINPDLEEELSLWARRLAGDDIGLRVDLIQLARQRLNSNVAPLLNVESLLIGIHRPELAG